MEASPPSTEPRPAAPCPRQARTGDRALPLILLVAAGIVGATLAAFGPRNADPSAATPGASSAASTDWTPSPRPAGTIASLTIDFGNGAEREFHALPWTEGMTLGDLMERARDFRPGISFTQKGKGEMAMLTSLEGVANETAGGRYWLYSVDGRHGEVSFAVQPLAAGAAVLWEFRRGE